VVVFKAAFAIADRCDWTLLGRHHNVKFEMPRPRRGLKLFQHPVNLTKSQLTIAAENTEFATSHV